MLIYVLVVSAALSTLLALALDVVCDRAEESSAITRGLELESAAAQASAAAEAWFAARAASITGVDGFEPDAVPEADPTHSIPAGIFEALLAEYPRLSVESVCYDLHYPDSFAEKANDARIPRIAPFNTKDGGVARAYYIRTTAIENDGGTERRHSVGASLRVKKLPSGLIAVRRTGILE